MSDAASDGRVTARRGRDWLTAAIGLALLVAVGVVAGLQYVSPDKRVLAVMAALVMFGITVRLDMVTGTGLLLLALPYPRANVYGNTNLALILLLLIIWLLRVNTGSAERPHRTPLDVPILALVICYVVSFYNVEKAEHLPFALANFVLFLACIGIYYLIVENVRRPQDLERLLMFQVATVASACLLAVWELSHPGHSLIPGWIDFHERFAEGIDIRNYRVGGPFFDYEQLSDFCAVNMMLAIFLVARARSVARRVMFIGFLILIAFVLFATVTRGAIISLAIGLLYLVWVLRRHVRFVPLTVAAATTVALFVGMDFYVSRFTHSGDVFKRLIDPATLRFKNGLPEGRKDTWMPAFGRMMEHPIIGHGPYYSLKRGLSFWYWPHNVYLYIGNLIGIVGLTFFLWLMWKLWRLSKPLTTDVIGGDYAQAYLVFAHVQLLIFAIDQLKIDYLRNPIYQFQVWVMFALLVSASQLARNDRALVLVPDPATAIPSGAPVPARLSR